MLLNEILLPFYQATKLNYRGARIWNAVMDDLLSNGMNKAKNALLTGESAGGLASILHCDKFSALFTSQSHVKCLSDGGFFVNLKDISGTRWIENYYNDVVTTHGSADSLPSSCTLKLSPSLCFFPQNVVQYVETPLFVLNSAYDSWQISNVLIPSTADPNDIWHDCKINIKCCSSYQLDIFQGFREGFLNALNQTKDSTLNGLFINSCFVHVQSVSQDTWLSPDSPMLHNTTVANAVGDWYFDRRDFEEIDCAYPCDKTCINKDWYFDRRRFEDYYEPVLRNQF
ncbi:hypothetical protein LUZ60_016991 [Juncus effusus]|nr:hypothetical protein LUZ60_016991 [Juncus effusus]